MHDILLYARKCSVFQAFDRQLPSHTLGIAHQNRLACPCYSERGYAA